VEHWLKMTIDRLAHLPHAATQFPVLRYTRDYSSPQGVQWIYQLKGGRMKLSARNILKGMVVKIVRGAVNAEVTLQLSGGEKVVSVITNGSVESLGLKEGQPAYAVIKSSSVMIAVD
jgi:molybdopterin-binding protein